MNPDEFRQTGHRVVDMLADYFARVEDEPLFPNPDPRAIRESFAESLPQEGTPADAIIDELEEKLLPFCTQVNHPGYFGYITPTATPVGVIGDLIASALNQNLGLWSIGPSAVAIERQTVRWLDDLIGYGSSAGGNLTSGGMMANFIALKLARDWVSGDSAQYQGTPGNLAAYCSEERHVSIDKAVDTVGIGRNMLRVLPTDENFRLDLHALEAALADDEEAGIRPACIIAAGGSTNNGAVDDLARLRAIADSVGAWLHVDTAYGGGMLLSQKYPGVLKGLSAADSVTLDPHKWFYAPLDVGAVLVRDESRLTKSFGIRPPYLDGEQMHVSERYDYYVHGFEQSRRFRSLKVWMGFKRYGAKQIGAWVDANVDQARRLYELANAHPDFQPATFPHMSAICLRYAPAGFDESKSAQLHTNVMERVTTAGQFWFSTTVMKGHTWFRINPVNFRTKLEHMDRLFGVLCEECVRVRRSELSRD